uniref:low affinity immunoglobulin gamma Fc region receptor III-like isoform X2 n=1 Tax=Monopterus albus TaxID=43700 RepID=UPI0009B347A5|nr:low affinity immunoglobulin gamma Fc region receptor III-like isoform X2 [Monopterus albus]
MKAALLFLWWLIYRTSAHGRASIVVSPSRSQYFEYDQVSLSCQHSSSDPWTVWRYTTTGLNLSHCGSDWGSQMSSTCDMKTVKPSDSGVYWCESRERESSNAINITVTDKPVILDSPVLPVAKGNDVTLRCTAGSSSNLAAEFYRYDRSIGTGSTGHMTIPNFSKSDEGEYKCSISGHGESPPSWVLLKDDSDPASLTASPNSSQWFEYDDLFLSCAVSSSRHKWVIKRSTTTNLSSCGEQWGTLTSSGCIVKTAKQADSGIYWCESPARQRSNSVQITVYGGSNKEI